MGKIYDINGKVLENTVSEITEKVKEFTAEIPTNALAYHSDWDNLVNRGFCERTLLGNVDENESYPIYLYKFLKNKDWCANYTVSEYDGTNDLYERPKILITSCFHGNERATPSFVLSFFETLCNDSKHADILYSFDWYVIPLVNPWGYSNSLISTENGSVMWVDTAPNGFDENGIPIGYTVVNNEDGYYAGIRRNADGYDINRDWSDSEYNDTDGFTYGFKTKEAQLVKEVLLSKNFDVAIDFHQAPGIGGSWKPTLCGFVSLYSKPSNMDEETYNSIKTIVYSKITQAGAKTDCLMCEYLGMSEPIQTSYIWTAGSGKVFRNYAGGSDGNTANIEHTVKYSLCMETSPHCYAYSNSSDTYGEIANTYGNTFVYEFLKEFLEIYK